MADDKSANQDIYINIRPTLDEIDKKDALQKLEAISEVYDELQEQIERLGKVDTQWAKKDKETLTEKLELLKKYYNLNDDIIKQIKNIPKEETKKWWKEGSKELRGGMYEGFTGSNSFMSIKSSSDLGRVVGQKLYQGLKLVADKIKEVFKDAIAEMKEMWKQSYLTNEQTRENAFTYGMSAAQSYGFEKAKTMLGGLSDEDLMYMNSSQAQKFRELMIKYTQKYNELYDQGYYDKMLEYEITKEEFKQDFQLELIKFFLDNKDTIMDVMNAVINIAKGFMNFLGSMRVASASDVISNYTNNKSINVDTTFNISGQVNREMVLQFGQQSQSYADEVINNL